MNAHRTVILSGMAAAAAVTVGSARRGELPRPRQLLAGGIVFIALAALADSQPKMAAPTAILVAVSVTLIQGEDAAKGILAGVTSKAKLGTKDVPKAGAPDVGSGTPAASTPGAPSQAAPGVLGPIYPGSPIAGQMPHAATHETAGLPGYPAYDYMAPAGTTVVSPVAGAIFRLTGKDPKLGGPPGGPLGYSIYIQGTNGKSYYLTHLDRVAVKVGQRVTQGQPIAVVANGPPSWSSPHVHMGVSR